MCQKHPTTHIFSDPLSHHSFVFRGKASQVVVAMIISAISVALYINWKPYIKHTDNQLAIISQTAIFFTLFAALLTKVEVDKRDGYDVNTFGYLLIFVNLMVIVLFFGQVRLWEGSEEQSDEALSPLTATTGCLSTPYPPLVHSLSLIYSNSPNQNVCHSHRD
jgi:hypothetical protein